MPNEKNEECTEVLVGQCVIKGYHSFKIRPPMIDDAPLLTVDREYCNIHDKNACLVWLPGLEEYKSEFHQLETDKTRKLKLNDIAGLPIGHVPRGLGGCFREILDRKDLIYAEVTGEPRPSFPPWPAPHETGGGAVIPCSYIIKCKDVSTTTALIRNALQEMEEKTVMTVTWRCSK